MKSATLKVEGMHCTGCAAMIHSRVATLPGVKTADVSFEERQARVLYDPQIIEEHQIAEAVEKLGYRVVDPAAS